MRFLMLLDHESAAFVMWPRTPKNSILPVERSSLAAVAPSSEVHRTGVYPHQAVYPCESFPERLWFTHRAEKSRRLRKGLPPEQGEASFECVGQRQRKMLNRGSRTARGS